MGALSAPIAEIARDRRDRKARSLRTEVRKHGGPAEIEQGRKSLVNGDFPGLQYPCPHPNVDKQAVSGVPELYWRQNEYHFV